jgi:mono/diheme cytochrome c family protein
MRQRLDVMAFLMFLGCMAISALAQEQKKTAPVAASTSAAETHTSSFSRAGLDREAGEREMRLEGEKRFRTNCGRCHQAPHKFPPRVMATAIRHMRVRAMITEEDMRLILRFMTQ